mgnify:CR=1 FL=1
MLITQAITILYMMYYVLMFVSFLKLRHDQPNRPRLFKVPGGNVGAWLVAALVFWPACSASCWPLSRRPR